MLIHYCAFREQVKDEIVELELIKTNTGYEFKNIEQTNELGIHLGADTSSRLNGTVGGEMTRRLVNLGKQYYTNVNNRIK